MAGYSFYTWWFYVTPLAALAAASFNQPSYNESLAGGSVAGGARVVNSQTTTSVPLSLGFQLDRTFPVAEGWTLQPTLRTAWVHEFDTSRDLTAGFEAIPGPSFEVTGASAAANSALIKGSLYLAHGPGLALFALGVEEQPTPARAIPSAATSASRSPGSDHASAKGHGRRTQAVT